MGRSTGYNCYSHVIFKKIHQGKLFRSITSLRKLAPGEAFETRRKFYNANFCNEVLSYPKEKRPLRIIIDTPAKSFQRFWVCPFGVSGVSYSRQRFLSILFPRPIAKKKGVGGKRSIEFFTAEDAEKTNQKTGKPSSCFFQITCSSNR